MEFGLRILKFGDDLLVLGNEFVESAAANLDALRLLHVCCSYTSRRLLGINMALLF
jgi:hypothetical protein